MLLYYFSVYVNLSKISIFCCLSNNHRGGVLESGCKSTANIPFHQIFLRVFCEKVAFYGLSLMQIKEIVSKREIKKDYSIKKREKKEEEGVRTYTHYYIYRVQKLTTYVLSLPPTLFLKRMLSYHHCR